MTTHLRALRWPSAVALAALMLASSTIAAHADVIANDLDATIDSTAEVMPLEAGGAPGQTTLYVQPRNGDGRNGCNLRQSATLTVTVMSSDPTVATVSPSTVTFSSCGDTEVVTVTPIAVGSTSVTLLEKANTTSGTFDVAPAAFTVNVTSSPNTPPSVVVTGVTAGGSYEFGAVPTPGCAVTDAEDGSSTPPASLTDVSGPLAAYGLGTRTATCTYTDAGGLTATSSVTYSIVDTTAPTISLVSRTPANDEGWNNGNVVLAWSCTDLVGVEADSVTATLTAEGAGQSATGTCTDVAGNRASDTQAGINIDKTPPTITWTGGPSDGASYYFGQVPSAAACTATDTLSGAKDCEVAGYGSTVGTHTMTATAHDKAGNVTTETRAYTVLAWTLGGFYQPVDMGDVWNTVKNGSTLPLKFEVFAGATELRDTAVVDSFTVRSLSCSVTVNVDDIDLTTTGGTSLRYDTTAGQFVQNWQTPKTPGACYQVTMRTEDGSSISANFRLK